MAGHEAFFEKRPRAWRAPVKPPLAQDNKSFLVLFFKKEPLCFPIQEVFP
jgi:hypothetical protein